jgi:ATP-dependent RNA helicase RhlE
VGREQKRELLAHLVKSNNWQQVLVFTRTKHGANRLAQQLERDGIDADAIHGNKSQGARTRALKRFKDNELQVLVATDIAARGLDIEELPHVVNYDLPHVAEDYVHRIGRTGRAGASGEAVSLVSADDRPLLAAIERLIGRRIEQKTAAGFEAGSQSAAPASGEAQQNHRPRQERGRQQAAPARHGNNEHRRQDGRQQQGSRNEPGSHGRGHNGQGRSGQRERPQQPGQPDRGNGGNRTQDDRQETGMSLVLPCRAGATGSTASAPPSPGNRVTNPGETDRRVGRSPRVACLRAVVRKPTVANASRRGAAAGAGARQEPALPGVSGQLVRAARGGKNSQYLPLPVDTGRRERSRRIFLFPA